jgi:hypothetical protein
MRKRRIAVLAVLLAAAAGAAWLAARVPPAAAPGGAALEIRWHGHGIVLQGAVPDAATQQALVEGATARLGGESSQVIDWLDIRPDALPVADAAALAQLIRLGQEGWHLQRRAAEGSLALPRSDPAHSAPARELLQRAFGPDLPVRLIDLP